MRNSNWKWLNIKGPYVTLNDLWGHTSIDEKCCVIIMLALLKSFDKVKKYIAEKVNF